MVSLKSRAPPARASRLLVRGRGLGTRLNCSMVSLNEENQVKSYFWFAGG